MLNYKMSLNSSIKFEFPTQFPLHLSLNLIKSGFEPVFFDRRCFCVSTATTWEQIHINKLNYLEKENCRIKNERNCRKDDLHHHREAEDAEGHVGGVEGSHREGETKEETGTRANSRGDRTLMPKYIWSLCVI